MLGPTTPCGAGGDDAGGVASHVGHVGELHRRRLPAERPGNVAVFAFRDSPGPLEWKILESRAQILEKALGLEFTRFAEHLKSMNRHDSRLLYP